MRKVQQLFCQCSLDAAFSFTCHCLLAAAWPACLTAVTWWLALAWLVSLYECHMLAFQEPEMMHAKALDW